MTRHEMNVITDGDWDRDSGDWTRWFMHETQNDRTVQFDKKAPVNKTVNYWFWRCPQDMTSDDELLGLHRIMTPLVIELGTGYAHRADGNLTEWKECQSEYMRMLPRALLAIEKLHESDAPQIVDWVGSTWE